MSTDTTTQPELADRQAAPVSVGTHLVGWVARYDNGYYALPPVAEETAQAFARGDEGAEVVDLGCFNTLAAAASEVLFA